MKHEVGTKVIVGINNELQEGKIYALIQGEGKYAIKLDNGTLMFASEEQVFNIHNAAKEAVKNNEKNITTNKINQLINETQTKLGTMYSRAMDLQEDCSSTELQYLDNFKEAIIQCVKDIERYRQSE